MIFVMRYTADDAKVSKEVDRRHSQQRYSNYKRNGARLSILA